MKSVYLIGSLRNPRVQEIATYLRQLGWQVFDDWHAVGEDCDIRWKEYEQKRGRTLPEALAGAHAQNVFLFDKTHLDNSECAVVVLPAGRSAMLELGYVIGTGKPGFVLLDGDPDRWDVMLAFSTGVFLTVEDLLAALTCDKVEVV